MQYPYSTGKDIFTTETRSSQSSIKVKRLCVLRVSVLPDQFNMNGQEKKIISRESLAQIVRDIKARGATIVTTNGSFDLLHIGHVTMLQEAKSLGDVLIVGLNSDLSVRRYKGKGRPICPQNHRAGMLAALEYTDYITIFDELTPIPLLEQIQPNIHVNSPEHGRDCVEREVVERHGGRIYLSQLVAGMSTSQLLKRISATLMDEAAQGLFLNPIDIQQEPSEQLLPLLQQLQASGFRSFLLETTPLDLAGFQNLSGLNEHELEIKRLPGRLDDLATIDWLVETENLSLAKSFLLSSAMPHIQMGRAVNCKTILLANPPSMPEANPAIAPHYRVASWQEAVALLKKS